MHMLNGEIMSGDKVVATDSHFRAIWPSER